MNSFSVITGTRTEDQKLASDASRPRLRKCCSPLCNGTPKKSEKQFDFIEQRLKYKMIHRAPIEGRPYPSDRSIFPFEELERRARAEAGALGAGGGHTREFYLPK